MVLLLGYGADLTHEKCNPFRVGDLGGCPFLWRYFRDNGYVTAYVEDVTETSTFNYNRNGFIQQPTDSYLRQFFLALEKYLPLQIQANKIVCLGYTLYSDYIFQSAMDFASIYLDDPHFGLYWTNAFSHDNSNLDFNMDHNIKWHMEELERRGILKHDMVIFMSDHGTTYGPIVETETGWYEDRMPFMYIWLPEWFRNEHPDFASALRVNRNRLTTPFDIHTTMKHVLTLSGRIDNLPPSSTCPKAQSLFQEVPLNRSCEAACIPNHYCVCDNFEGFDVNTDEAKGAVLFVLDDINKRLINYKLKRGKCAFLTLKKITKAKVAVFNGTDNPSKDYRVVFEVKPSKAIFGTTITFFTESKEYKQRFGVSRMNAYGTESHCMPDKSLKDFCYCL